MNNSQQIDLIQTFYTSHASANTIDQYFSLLGQSGINMNYNELITSIFQIVIIPCLGLLTGFFIKWINAKINELAIKTKNEKEQKYLYMLKDTITSAVIAVNQTYVDSLR